MTVQGGDPRELIEGSQGLVRSLASKIHRTLPPYVELDDLIAYGQVGLAEAARDFEPDRGTQFSTFAYYRIRGAIYDGLAKMTWFSRSQYKQIRLEQMANATLGAEHEAEAESPEADSGSLEEQVRWFRRVTRSLSVVYLATQVESPEGLGAGDVEDVKAATPPAAAAAREARQKLVQLIDALPEQEKYLIRAVYYEGQTLQEAARSLGISKSWASRVHAKTLGRLGRSLQMVGVA
jgi:RNA polymerase sigma factor for flagellar operon FliA